MLLFFSPWLIIMVQKNPPRSTFVPSLIPKAQNTQKTQRGKLSPRCAKGAAVSPAPGPCGAPRGDRSPAGRAPHPLAVAGLTRGRPLGVVTPGGCPVPQRTARRRSLTDRVRRQPSCPSAPTPAPWPQLPSVLRGTRAARPGLTPPASPQTAACPTPASPAPSAAASPTAPGPAAPARRASWATAHTARTWTRWVPGRRGGVGRGGGRGAPRAHLRCPPQCAVVTDVCFSTSKSHRCVNTQPGFHCLPCPPRYKGSQPFGVGLEAARTEKQVSRRRAGGGRGPRVAGLHLPARAAAWVQSCRQAQGARARRPRRVLVPRAREQPVTVA